MRGKSSPSTRCSLWATLVPYLLVGVFSVALSLFLLLAMGSYMHASPWWRKIALGMNIFIVVGVCLWRNPSRWKPNPLGSAALVALLAVVSGYFIFRLPHLLEWLLTAWISWNK
jgi:hypothetical protein